MTGWTEMQGQGGRGRTFPLGAVGVAALAALVGAIIGLVLPMAWIEELSWQLYLDQLVAAARPPLGDTARLVMIALMALALGLLGWVVAAILRVRRSPLSISDWLAGMRGQRAEDEPDAPHLRAADRHPDAPARRPFSAARDVPVRDAGATAPRWDIDEDDADELLLNAQFGEAQLIEGVEPVAIDESASEARWDALDVVDTVDAEAAPAVLHSDTYEFVIDARSGTVSTEAEPLDLSVARLDELIARLEAGLSRRETAARQAVAVPSLAAEAGAGSADLVDAAPGPALARGGTEAAAEPSFPQDPALAAALATLRRMNRVS